MERREKSFNLKRRFRETLAMALSILMAAGTVLMPVSTMAAEDLGNREFTVSDLEGYTGFIVIGDSIVLPNGTFGKFRSGEEGWSGAEPLEGDEIVSGDGYYSNARYTFVGSEPVGHPFLTKNSTFGDEEDGIHYSWNMVDAFEGFRVRFYNGSTLVNESGTACSPGTVKYQGAWTIGQNNLPLYDGIGTDSIKGDVIGFSNASNFDQTSGAKFIRSGNGINYNDFYAEAYSNYCTLNLYAVYDYTTPATALSVSMSDYSLDDGVVPSPRFTTSRTDTDDFEVEYFKDGEDASLGSDAPEAPGSYRIEVTAPAVSTEFNADDTISKRGFIEETAEDTFTVTGTASLEKEPTEIDNLTYNGTAQDLINPGVAEHGTIYYRIDGDESSQYSTSVPKAKDAGDYTVVYYVEGKDGYEDSDIEEISVTMEKKQVELEWSVSGEIPYDGGDHYPKVTASGVYGSDDCQVAIKLVKNRAEVDKAVEIGTYTATAVRLSNSNYSLPAEQPDREIQFEIVKGIPEIITAPAPKADLQYSGQAQALINEGKADGGTLLYSLKEDGEYSEDIPTAKAVGKYTVWYMVKGDENYDDLSPKSMVAEIEKKTVGLQWANTSFAYDGKMHCPIATATGVAPGETCLVTVTGEASTIGTHMATATALSNANYALPKENTTSFTIGLNLPTIKTAPAARNLTENGNYQELVTAGVVENGTILYSTAKDGSYSTAIPTGKDAGEYTVWYKVNGNSINGVKSYGDIDPISVKVTIAKKQEGGKEESKPNPQPSGLKAGSVTLSVGNGIYGGTLPDATVTSSTNDVSKGSVFYKPSNAPDSEYSTNRPTEVGRYMAKVTLPATGEYGECTSICEFSIGYLPVPDGSYSITGKTGNAGWYTTEVTLVPGAGYQIALGTRAHFVDTPIILSEASGGSTFFIRKKDTGEQTAGIQISSLKIDTQAPQIKGMENGGIYFVDDTGALKATASDKNLKKVLVDGTEVKTVSDGNGNVTFDLPYGKRKQTVKISVYDDAGNETSMNVTTAPAWMKDGIIVEGDLYLEGGTLYKTPEGSSTWTAGGDSTTYMGGISFYSKEGDYTFTKH